ncbi:MAG: hypothetical protein OXG11_07775 [Chloroflexi bacterium]|nr:hypothetical protein [Chloroflexota bacterium]
MPRNIPKNAKAVLPMVPVVCRGCGYVMQFLASELERHAGHEQEFKRPRA